MVAFVGPGPQLLLQDMLRVPTLSSRSLMVPLRTSLRCYESMTARSSRSVPTGVDKCQWVWEHAFLTVSRSEDLGIGVQAQRQNPDLCLTELAGWNCTAQEVGAGS